MSTAFLPGSFDPPTNGHLALIEKAAKLFQKLYIGVTDNPQKKRSPLFPVDERVLLIKALIAHLSHIEVISFKGLTVDYANKLGANCLIRGVRNGSDYESEISMAFANRILGKMETCILPTEPTTIHISSTLVREILAAKGPLEAFLPKQVISAIINLS